MAKISENERQAYSERVKSYVDVTKALLKTEKDLAQEARKKPSEAPMIKLALADEMLNLASNYIAVNGVSQALLRVKNEESLNDARKSLYKAVIYLEEIVSNLIDVPFSDYEDKLKLIVDFDPNQRYNLIRKLGFSIDLLVHTYGDNTKWRWTFVELEGRFATAAKNILDLKNVYTNSSPESPYYDSTVYHLRLVKKLLNQSADRYREKYELSTSQFSDFKTGISYLAALRRIHIVLAEAEESESIKKKHAIWKQKLEADMKKQEEMKKRGM
ncbi:MAG: hypothetical protein LBU88_10590 [Treponema sp.]|jgi:hypothetical protein|nr:hypothetical protein [Treponema sp.]